MLLESRDPRRKDAVQLENCDHCGKDAVQPSSCGHRGKDAMPQEFVKATGNCRTAGEL